MKKKKQYHPGKLKPFAQIIALAVKREPHLADNPDLLWATVITNIPALAKKDECPNCHASMQQYVFEFDLMDALLLFSMAKEVRRRLEIQEHLAHDRNFTSANQIKTTQLAASYAVRSRTTQCSKLGLIAKLRGENGAQVPGTWVITHRGWQALAGKPVPKSVLVWRGNIMERTEELTTISEALRSHERKITDLIKRNKIVRTDYRDAFSDYDPEEWIHTGPLHEGDIV